MRVALVSDAWAPQVNGVVRTLATTVAQLRARGTTVETITPDTFRTVPCPTYPEIRLAVGCRRAVRTRLEAFAPDAVHIATEGPLGWAARRWCLDLRRPFTTSFHTRFPDYAAVRTGLPARMFWPVVRRFHAPAERVFAATPTLAAELGTQGIGPAHIWSRGVDLDLFRPAAPRLAALACLPRPIQLYVGRIAVEKNLAAFLATGVPGSKVLVGEGPARAQLQAEHPEARFLGPLHGAALASAYASADIFVFPSRTDTFGLVMIEALACGLPIAGLPVPGPLDIIGADGLGHGTRRAPIGVLDEDLGGAIARAAGLSRRACAEEGARYSWAACTNQFVAGLAVSSMGSRSIRWTSARSSRPAFSAMPASLSR